MDRVTLGKYLQLSTQGQSTSSLVASTFAAAVAAQVAYNLLHDGDVLRRSFKYLLSLGRAAARPLIAKAIDKAAKDITFPHGGDYESFNEIPSEGLSAEHIRRISGALHAQLDKDMAKDRLSGVVYVGTSGKTDVITDVIREQLWANPLFADYFGATRKIEAEVVQMMVTLFNGRTSGVSAADQQCGVYTFGGTESVLMAMLAMRNYARSERGIKRPNVVVSTSAHPAFDKAAEYFDIRLVKVSPDPVTQILSVAEVENHITYETIGLVGSAPNFAHGTVDPIEELAELASSRNLLFHVDACLGGMAIQFMNSAGFEQPKIDFRIKGVTSISCDIHKWGGAPKGASVVLYRGAWLRQHQTFAYADYPGGLYVTPSINGSKAGYVIAAAWATMLNTGRKQYTDNVRRVVSAARAFTTSVNCMPLLRIVGEPTVTTVAFTSDLLDIYEIKHRLSKKGWLMNPCQFPPCVHLGVTLEHTKPGAMLQLIEDLSDIVEEMAKERGFKDADEAELALKSGKVKGKQAHRSMVYGSTQAIPDRSIIQQVLRRYVDGYYVNDEVRGTAAVSH
jgi:sphinganine-1-phosphate aldolase